MQEFLPFGWPHQIVLAIVAGAAFILIRNKNRIIALRDDSWKRRLWAAGLLGLEAASWFYHARKGWMALPLHLCDWAVFLTAWALWGKKGFVTELAFFWGVAASSQALLTPDLRHGFLSLEWILFFSTHGGVVLGALYLLVRGQVRLTPFSPWRVWLATNGYAVVAGLVNWQIGTNFGYLAGKPRQASLLDYLGPWPVYLFWVELIAFVLFYACYRFARAVSAPSDPGAKKAPALREKQDKNTH